MDIESRLESIERRLDALIAVQLEYIAANERTKAPRKPEVLLRDFGFLQVEIARIVGKTQSAVSQVLARR